MTDDEFNAVMLRISQVLANANRAATEAEAALERVRVWMAAELIAETEEFLREQA